MCYSSPSKLSTVHGLTNSQGLKNCLPGPSIYAPILALKSRPWGLAHRALDIK